MKRRWEAGWTDNVSGIEFRIVEGRKEPGDLRMEWRTAGGWLPVKMSAVFMLTDFFVENEQHLKQFRPHWTETGADYFFRFLSMAVQDGWTAAAGQLEEQRVALRPTVRRATVRWCRSRHPEENVVCTLAPDHDGPHKWNDTYVWPRVAA